MNEEQVLFAAFVIPTTRERYVELLATKRGREKVRSALDPFKDLIRVSAEEFLESTPMRLLYFTNFGSSERRTSATSFPSAPIWMGVICRCLMRLRLRLAGGGVRSFHASAEYLDISRVRAERPVHLPTRSVDGETGKNYFPGFLPRPSCRMLLRTIEWESSPPSVAIGCNIGVLLGAPGVEEGIELHSDRLEKPPIFEAHLAHLVPAPGVWDSGDHFLFGPAGVRRA